MSKEVDAWEDEWSNVADKQPTPTSPHEPDEPKKVSSKVSKAQRRAQQAEFNRQLWAEAEGPQETNFFLESRNVVPLRSEFKPPPILLSRKGPIIQSSRPLTSGMQALSLNKDANAESSDDEDESKARELTLAERQARAAKEREEKQRRYEERRLELFGPTDNGNNSHSNTPHHHHHNNHHHHTQQQQQNASGTSTPSTLTPPGSRSATPNRGRGRGGGRRGGGNAGIANMNMNTNMNMNSRTHSRGGSQQRERERDLYDPLYLARPDSSSGHNPSYMQRRAENGIGTSSPGLRPNDIQQPIRAPKGPDGSGRGGFGFANHRIGQVGGDGS
ncbi:hypothetical protein A1O1_06588 [Capronia coronata CBS 617.96]|uniref:Uncharacterized protein n=1 Tax=Capronia coronata CBS 617.96 TaxID=1182541 RepID=W9Y150_9EURO|nr:uncharacterized protein A1O1_06588 [Capronia coronata CBS 617.96]EXJ86218.1 hypothetical protein A1O1_06588 [Capronia coronata CBS 617.96]